MKSQISQRAALLLLASIAALPAWGQVTNFTGTTSDRFGIVDNWDNGIPSPAVAGVVDSRRVEIATLNEMVVGATIDFNGTSSLERNSFSQAAYSGVININDSTNVKISSWWPEENSILNWNSSGTFSLAPSGAHNQSRLYFQGGRDNAVVNINDGFWDMRGDTSAFSVRVLSGTINMNGGLMIADKAFNLGAGFLNSSGTVNYSASAEIRTKTIGVFVQSVFNFEGGATLYVESGLLGPFGEDGFTWLRDMLRQTDDRGIYINGVRQTIGATEGLEASNFSTATVELGGIWYNALTANAATLIIPTVTISDSGTDWVLSFPTESGTTYQARTSDALSTDPLTWATAGASLPGTGAPETIVLSKGTYPASPTRFFVVEVSN